MLNTKNTMLAIGTLASLSFGAPQVAQAEIFGDELKKTQVSQVKISISDAIQKAQAIHSGTIVKAELEDEDGKLVYEIEYLDIGKETEMLVDAITGEVTSGEDEEE
jgi:uncharacterized membrane protein YkoI